MKNSRFGDYLNEIEVTDTTDSQMYASDLDIHLEIDNGGRLKIQNSTTNAMS
jgi:hypothetical protein